MGGARYRLVYVVMNDNDTNILLREDEEASTTLRNGLLIEYYT